MWCWSAAGECGDGCSRVWAVGLYSCWASAGAAIVDWAVILTIRCVLRKDVCVCVCLGGGQQLVFGRFLQFVRAVIRLGCE